MILYQLLLLSLISVAGSAFNLTILHTNDVHARLEQHDKHGGICDEAEALKNECFGGVARRMTKIREIREVADVLLLDAGDQFQGTLWFLYYWGMAAAYFMTSLGYDAMAVGNHEFDNSPDGLEPFVRNVSFPLLSANMDASEEPVLDGLINKSAVLTVRDERIGVVGYTYYDTDIISKTRDVHFSAEVPAVQKEVDRLKRLGINKIIAVGHSGLPIDKKIANEVKGVDVVIGGHSNSFLYDGDPPSTEKVDGPYPIVINPSHSPNSNVLVVQDYTFGKYLGYLNVVFDSEGEITSWTGNPILLDHTVAQDSTILSEIEKWAEPVKDQIGKVVGRTNVFLQGDRNVCRKSECNLGNLVTEAFVAMNLVEPDELRWSRVGIALWNGGGIRQSVPVGRITIGDLNMVLPFGNTVDIVEIKGKYIREALEFSVYKYGTDNLGGEFLQMTGLHVTYDVTKQPGSRVVDVEAVCTECTVPEYKPLVDDEIYNIIVSDYIANGGDGYSMISDNKLSYVTGNLDSHKDFTRLSFLTIGDPPSTEKVDGPYPIVINPSHSPNSNVLVVQDYTFGKYLGYLNVVFDSEGEITSWTGNPILLDHTVAQDSTILSEIEKWAEPVKDQIGKVVGRTNVFLQGDRNVCRKSECNLGNLVTEAFVAMNLVEPDELRWSRVGIALWNGGGIRQSVPVGEKNKIGLVM
ncbi:snake venom 5'-nucleotidase-like [Anneissia japonica]|uniref:snake venom 5'-nucleotidase-like n=1 Tax=Anneissia japonica TaxID=1529436 RepID=UPI0014256CA2|nr:snake venom 5'-nucleotidase-like [Anneissia japonica]